MITNTYNINSWNLALTEFDRYWVIAYEILYWKLAPVDYPIVQSVKNKQVYNRTSKAIGKSNWKALIYYTHKLMLEKYSIKRLRLQFQSLRFS